MHSRPVPRGRLLAPPSRRLRAETGKFEALLASVGERVDHVGVSFFRRGNRRRDLTVGSPCWPFGPRPLMELPAPIAAAAKAVVGPFDV